MFKRLSNSLTSPKEVAKYYHESFWKSLIIFLILLVLIMVPIVVNLLTTDFLTYQTKEDLKAAFYKEEIPFKIENGIVKNVNGEEKEVYINNNFYQYKIVITEKLENYVSGIDGIAIVICDDGVYGKVAMASQNFIKFSDYEYFKNVDLSNPSTLKDFDFWNNTFSVIEKLSNESKPMYVIIYSIYYVFYWIVWLSVFCLIISMFSKMRVFGALKYWDLFKISFYSLTPFVICSIFSSLFNLGFLIYVGYLLSAIYNIITVNEVLKNTYSVRREGE